MHWIYYSITSFLGLDLDYIEEKRNLKTVLSFSFNIVKYNMYPLYKFYMACNEHLYWKE